LRIREKHIIALLKKFARVKSLRSIIESDPKNLPAVKTFLDWVAENEELRNQYAKAMTVRAELKFESIEQDYSEQPQRDPDTGKIDPGWVSLQRLKIDAKKWELSKLMPKKYGDKQETTHIIEQPIFNGIDLNVSKDNGAS
jgi:alkylated DNA repair dioxygenase AlkB